MELSSPPTALCRFEESAIVDGRARGEGGLGCGCGGGGRGEVWKGLVVGGT